MGRRTCALYKGKIYTWIELLDKFGIEHVDGTSAHTEWNSACLHIKLPKIEVIYWDGVNKQSDNERETFILKNNNITKRHRQFVWNRDIGDSKSGKCYVCDNVITDDNFETSHVISKHNGGTNHVSNLRATCLPCNRAMGTTNLEDFKKDFIVSQFNDYLKIIDVTKEDVIEFLETHKPNDENVKFFNKAIELLEGYKD